LDLIAAPSYNISPENQDSKTAFQSATRIFEQEIPDSFLGRWDVNFEACLSGISDEHLIIERGDIFFYESHGVIQKLTIHDHKKITILAEMSAEREFWESEFTFQLSADSNMIIEGSFDRVRCQN
jgi:hypothetical protein